VVRWGNWINSGEREGTRNRLPDKISGKIAADENDPAAATLPTLLVKVENG